MDGSSVRVKSKQKKARRFKRGRLKRTATGKKRGRGGAGYSETPDSVTEHYPNETEDEHIVRGGSFRAPPKYHRAACIAGRCVRPDLCAIRDIGEMLYKDIGFRITLNKDR